MLLCDAPEFVHWTPDFSSSGQTSPSWTQVVCGGAQVINGLEAVEWDENPVQLVVCEACGIVDCAYGGYAHVSRAGSYVVLSEPRLPGSDPNHEDHQYAASAAVVRFGVVLVPLAVWSAWPAVGATDALPVTRRHDLAGGWLAEAPPREDAIAADVGTVEDGLAAVDAVDRWFEADPEAEVEELVPVAPGKAITLFYDSPRFTEWTPAVRVDGAWLPVLGGFTVAATSAGIG